MRVKEIKDKHYSRVRAGNPNLVGGEYELCVVLTSNAYLNGKVLHSSTVDLPDVEAIRAKYILPRSDQPC